MFNAYRELGAPPPPWFVKARIGSYVSVNARSLRHAIKRYLSRLSAPTSSQTVTFLYIYRGNKATPLIVKFISPKKKVDI